MTVPLAALAVVDTVPSRSPALTLMVLLGRCQRWRSIVLDPSSSTVAVDDDFHALAVVDTVPSDRAEADVVVDRLQRLIGFDRRTLTVLGAVVVGGGDGDGICSVEVGVRRIGDLARFRRP